MERFIDMLHHCARNSGDSSLPSYEPELVELMRQIDAMIEEKQVEWRKELQDVKKDMIKRDTEIRIMRKSLQERTNELDTLRTKRKIEQQNKANIIVDYNKEVSMLKQELDSLKRNYRKLLKKSSHNIEDNQDVDTAHINCRKQFSHYEERLTRMDLQKKSLVEKSEMMQEQLFSYQIQLNKKTKRLEEIERRKTSYAAERKVNHTEVEVLRLESDHLRKLLDDIQIGREFNTDGGRANSVENFGEHDDVLIGKFLGNEQCGSAAKLCKDSDNMVKTLSPVISKFIDEEIKHEHRLNMEIMSTIDEFNRIFMKMKMDECVV